MRTLSYSVDDLGIGQQLSGNETAAFGNLYFDGLTPSSLQSGQLISNIEQQAGTLFNGKTGFNNTAAGYRLGIDDDGLLKFYIGDSSTYLNWTGTALVISGSLTATTGAIGGFTIGTDYIRDAGDSFGLASTVSGSDDVRFWAGGTFANRATSAFRVTEAGAVTASSLTITGGAITGTPIASIPNSTATDISLLEKTWTMVFSVTDADTIAWTSGTITLSNSRTFSILSGNTGNMAALTYLYVDPAVSSTVLQTTTTAATAMGANKCLIGTARNNTVTASFIPYGPGTPLVDGANIGALSVVAGNIAAASITSTKISVSQLSAIAADMGTITAGTITGTTVQTASSGARFAMTSTAFQGINAASAVIFEIVLTGADSGDVILGDDATGQYAKWDNSAGTFSVYSNNVLIPTVQEFASSGTWTKPTALAYILVKAWGGGGSGASDDDHGATGGGGGCYMEKTFKAASLGATETVTIGNGGAAATDTNIGNAGGTTTFGSLLSAYGGGGGYILSNTIDDWAYSGGEGGTPFATGEGGTQVGTTGSGTVPPMSVYGTRVIGNTGGSGYLSGAGGGAVANTATAYAGGNALKGGAGGGAAHNTGSEGAGGTSIDGGNGGQGQDDIAGTAGSVRGGGGGGCSSGAHSSGAGGKGYLEVWHFYA